MLWPNAAWGVSRTGLRLNFRMKLISYSTTGPTLLVAHKAQSSELRPGTTWARVFTRGYVNDVVVFFKQHARRLSQ